MFIYTAKTATPESTKLSSLFGDNISKISLFNRELVLDIEFLDGNSTRQEFIDYVGLSFDEKEAIEELGNLALISIYEGENETRLTALRKELSEALYHINHRTTLRELVVERIFTSFKQEVGDSERGVGEISHTRKFSVGKIGPRKNFVAVSYEVTVEEVSCPAADRIHNIHLIVDVNSNNRCVEIAVPAELTFNAGETDSLPRYGSKRQPWEKLYRDTDLYKTILRTLSSIELMLGAQEYCVQETMSGYRQNPSFYGTEEECDEYYYRNCGNRHLAVIPVNEMEVDYL